MMGRLSKGSVMRTAVMDGKIEILKEFVENTPWDEFLSESSFGQIMSNASYNRVNRESAEHAVLMLLDLAIRDGKKEAFNLDGGDAGAVSFVEPVRSLIANGFDKVLAVFLDNGFDPCQVHGANNMNAIDVALENGSESTHALFLAYKARRVANDIVASMSLRP